MSVWKANLCILAAGSMWGTISIFVRQLDAIGLNALQICLIRTLLALLFVVALLAWRAPHLLRIRLRDCWCFLGTGVFSYALFSIFYFIAVAASQVSIAVMLLYTSPIFVMLLSALLFKEPLTLRKWAALGCTFLGCVLVSGVLHGSLAIPLFVLAVGLGAGFFYALYSIFGRYALRRYEPETVTCYTFAFAVAAMLPLGDVPTLLSLMGENTTSWLWALGIAFFCSVLPYFLYTLGLKYMETGKAAIMATIEPFVGAAIGIFIFQEPYDLMKLAGMALILSSVVILNKKKNQPGVQCQRVEK